MWRLNVSPRLGLAGNSGIFTCFFEGGYDLNTSKGTLDSILHRGELLYHMDFRFGDFLLKSDVGLFNAVSYFNENFEMEQIHDALDDALVTSMVYHQFKAYKKKK